MTERNLLSLLSKTYPFFLNILIALFVIFFLCCFKHSSSSHIPRWARIGLWQMFTHKSTYHSDLKALANFNDGWKEINLRELFPSKWDSGYRYQRHVFWRSKTRMRMLAASTCVRLEGKATEIKFFENYWKIIPGVPVNSKDKKKNFKEKLNLHWYCGNPVYTPKGTRVK